MALYNIASDLNTRQTIWVATNVVKQRPQLNSHSSECYARDGVDGFTALEIAGMSTPYVDNGWQAKYNDHITKWHEAPCA